ncbi:hypothetical protein AURDEDRAFT_156476 [Auricularia subglabra TFB-10046 SS5]|nr:hypothetical protein AURDEDRAFT_156476 [Auricularia subglabra TFB-10046 SS5]
MSFPAQNFDRYTWRPLPADEHNWVRHAVGGERYDDFLNRYVHGEQNLFLGRLLRYSLPTIALTTTPDAEDHPLMIYRVLQGAEEVANWVERTTLFHESGTDLDTLRVQLGKLTLPFANGDQTFIHIVPGDSTSKYSVLLHTHHTPFDGAGTKIVMSRFLRLLARALEDPTSAAEEVLALRWGGETANLLPAYCSVISEGEPLSGPLYEQTLGSIMQGFVENLPRKYGYKPRGEGISVGRRMEHKFSGEESMNIIDFARTKGLTVNQLVHAAVFLSATSDNPPSETTPADASFFTFGLMDCRSRLAPPHNDSYAGYCLGISGINVPLSMVSGETSTERLLAVANGVREEYAKQKALPALLGVIAQEIDLVLEATKAGPPPAPWMGPWYAGYGIGERYLEAGYMSADGAVEVIRVVDFFTSLNQVQPGPFFRSYSWNACLTISLDHNAAAMPAVKACAGFLKFVVETLLATI